MKEKMIILVGPSGAGKSSFVERIVEELPQLRDTVTYTTRAMRNGESEGKPYHFVSESKFRELIKEDFFVEWAEVHGNLYGTPCYQILDAWKAGLAIIMDVDVQGAKTFTAKYPQATTIFILPPSLDELRRRLEKRDGKTAKNLELRMENAQKELSMAQEFDIQITNSEFEKSYAEFKKIVEDLLAKP